MNEIVTIEHENGEVVEGVKRAVLVQGSRYYRVHNHRHEWFYEKDGWHEKKPVEVDVTERASWDGSYLHVLEHHHEHQRVKIVCEGNGLTIQKGPSFEPPNGWWGEFIKTKDEGKTFEDSLNEYLNRYRVTRLKVIRKEPT